MSRSDPIWIVTVSDGLDALLCDELAELGAHEITPGFGAIRIRASLETAYRICLWSRLASRVLMPLLEVAGTDPDALYAQAVQFDWTALMVEDASFAVRAAAAKGVRTHTRFAALRLKDAVVDQCRRQTGARPHVDTETPDVSLHLYLGEQHMAVSLDFSGEALHRRGYRTGQGEAPLKEHLAAAMLMQAGWPDQAPPALYDPFCGSGTLVIEAALMAQDAAPGLLRRRFGFHGWQGHQSALWQAIRDDAVARRQAGSARLAAYQLQGHDADARLVAIAQRNAAAAGVQSVTQFQVETLAQALQRTEGWPTHGLLVANPPYGERLDEDSGVKELYRALGRLMKQRLPAWTAVVLAADIEHADALGLTHLGTLRLFNGALPVFSRWGAVVPAVSESVFTFQDNVDGLPEAVLPFAHRLIKNCRSLFPWAQTNSVRCFRLYDADLPEFNLAVDRYEDRLHVQEYAAPSTVDPEKAAERFRLALQAIRHITGIPRDRVFLKVRARQSGAAQYAKQSKAGKRFEVREGAAVFQVNLTDYVDTGLFLDHRPMRARLFHEAQGRHVLNLFAYTGSISVQAGLGGAETTTTVDLSPTYCGWARRHVSLNGLPHARHRVIQADVMTWLLEEQEHYELIFVDPPTFSNSKRLDDVFDVQRDHVRLIDLAMDRLTLDGVLYFSNNFRKFQLDEALSTRYEVRDIGPETIDQDFVRQPKIHHCWQIRHRSVS